MNLQSGLSDCGAVALANGLQAIGIDAKPELVRSLAGTTGDGTDRAGLKTAARKLEADVSLISTRDPELALHALRGALHAGSSAVLLVDKTTHWVTAIGVLGAQVLVFDSACTDREMVEAFTPAALLEAWRCKRTYYAIVLRRRT